MPSLLVVDDEPVIRFAMREYFSPRGFDIALADDVAEAVILLGSRRFDLLLVDLRLHGSDDECGLSIVAHARRVAPATRIVILTAYGTPELQRRARAQGVSAFLYKPTPLAEVAQVVQALLAETEAEVSR